MVTSLYRQKLLQNTYPSKSVTLVNPVSIIFPTSWVIRLKLGLLNIALLFTQIWFTLLNLTKNKFGDLNS